MIYKVPKSQKESGRGFRDGTPDQEVMSAKLKVTVMCRIST